jgi:hypothetical protein
LNVTQSALAAAADLGCMRSSTHNSGSDHLGAVAVPPLSAIGPSGMKAAQSALVASAHNIANLSTPGFRRDQVSQAFVIGGGVEVSVSRAMVPGRALEADIVGQLTAKNQFLANLAVFKTYDEVLGTLLDIKG